jgi:uncharacterized membrane protein YkoI
MLETVEGICTYKVELVSSKIVRMAQIHAADGTLGSIVDAAQDDQPKPIYLKFSTDDLAQLDAPELTEPPAVTLSAAIALAQARVRDARFLHAELGIEDGMVNCLVCFWSGQDLRSFVVDARTSAVMTLSATKPTAESKSKMRAIANLSRATLSPDKAIAKAVATRPGSWARMLDVEIDIEPLNYMVELVSGKDATSVHISALDGSVIQVSEREEEEDEMGMEMQEQSEPPAAPPK